MKKQSWILGSAIFIILLTGVLATAQIFIPFSFWRTNRKITWQCESGCYPSPGPSAPFQRSFYYVPINAAATFSVSSSSNHDNISQNFDFCFGPTHAGGCSADSVANDIYPLSCSGGTPGEMDGSGGSGEATYTAPATANVSDTCWVTDYREGRASQSVVIRSFTPVSVSPAGTLQSSPINVCVNLTRAMTAAGGVGTLNWSVVSGGGSTSPLTGGSSTYTAPASVQETQVQVQDSTTSMTALVYFNVINSLSIAPTSIVETPINSSTSLQDPLVSSGTVYVYNLNFTANCGVLNYSASVSGSGSVSPTSAITNNQSIQFTPASTTGTSVLTITDSTGGTPQSVSQTIYSLLPVDITSNWGYHTCVKYQHSTYAAGTYKIKCWGLNANGQLGYGDTDNRGNLSTEIGFGLAFVKDIGITGDDMLVKDISAGWFHTCAILHDDTVKCWGSNTYGQLGYDNTTQLSSPSASVVDVGAGTPKKLYAGSNRTCLVYSDDRVKCWGRNANGELGQDNTTNYGSAGGGSSVTALGYISIGGSQLTVQRIAIAEVVTCALATASFTPGPSKIYCWGYGNNGTCNGTSGYCGELGFGTDDQSWGNGTNLMSALPAVNLGTSGTETVIDVAAGRKSVCAVIAPNTVAVTGQPICWGRNSRGQLGINNTNDIGENETPTTRVQGITTVKRMEMMRESTFAILSDDSVKCWGRGGNGQLLGCSVTGGGGAGYAINFGDDGTPLVSTSVTAKYGTGRTVKKLAAGYYFGCAILDNDYIKCWGAQYCGTGTNTTNNGCLLTGVSGTLSNNNATPRSRSRYIGDDASEVADQLPYLNH